MRGTHSCSFNGNGNGNGNGSGNGNRNDIDPSAAGRRRGAPPACRRAAQLLAAALLLPACSRVSSPPPPPRDAPAATVAAAPAAALPPPPVQRAPGDRVIELYLVTRLRNTLEACGCTSEPLGDVARLGALVKGKDSLLLDAGGLRYDETPTPVDKLPQARLKAAFLEDTWQALGAVTSLQPDDLRGDPAGGELAGKGRVASNVSGLPAGSVVADALRTVDGVRFGILGLGDPTAAWPQGVQVSDPVAAAQAGVQRLAGQGAQAIVALTGLRREEARRLARRVKGLAVVVAGGDRELADGIEQPEQAGDALLVVPGQKGERAVRIELHHRSGQPPVWNLQLSSHQKEQRAGQVAQQLAAAQARLATLRRDPATDPAFLKTTESEVQRLQGLQPGAAAAPLPTSYVVAELVPISRALPRDPTIAAQMTALDRRIGEANLAAAPGPPPAAPPGQPRYIGNAGCVAACHYHSDAVELWQKTHHATAWKTLVDGGKDLSFDCVGCHTTGFDAPGGANLWTVATWQRAQGGPPPPAAGPDLRNVGCETCHGPGSLHARAPSKIAMPVPKPTEDRCRDCHTKEHSDTFSITPYLRDILGPGHGEDRRRELGDGPTGHELRSAALRAHAPK